MATKPKTALGTPSAQSWDEPWLQRVDHIEQNLKRRICGAHAPDGEPCQLASKHHNGRCRFHGGHPRVGAQKGNRNALVHGLYSRRLKQCGDNCPLWDTCTYAGRDILALPHKKRPICVYEQTLYDDIARNTKPKEDPDDSDVGHPKNPMAHTTAIVDDTVATLCVMFNRAALTLSVTSITEKVNATGENYTMNSSKPSAALTALLRIGRELRAYLRIKDTQETQNANTFHAGLPLKDKFFQIIPYDANGERILPHNLPRYNIQPDDGLTPLQRHRQKKKYEKERLQNQDNQLTTDPGPTNTDTPSAPTHDTPPP